MHIEQRLGLDNCNLVGICVERVNMQFVPSCLEVDVAEWLKTADGEFRELHKYAAITSKSFKVGMTLTIEIWAHLFDLEIGHIAKAFGQRAFMISLAGESESFYQAAPWQKLHR